MAMMRRLKAQDMRVPLSTVMQTHYSPTKIVHGDVYTTFHQPRLLTTTQSNPTIVSYTISASSLEKKVQIDEISMVKRYNKCVNDFIHW